MKSTKLCLIFILLLNVAFAEKLEFISSDGLEYNREFVPELLVTEYLKEQGKYIQKGEVTKRWASYGKCQEVWKTDKFTIVCGTFGVWKYDNEKGRPVFSYLD